LQGCLTQILQRERETSQVSQPTSLIDQCQRGVVKFVACKAGQGSPVRLVHNCKAESASPIMGSAVARLHATVSDKCVCVFAPGPGKVYVCLQ
jgi:hypothetical protein